MSAVSAEKVELLSAISQVIPCHIPIAITRIMVEYAATHVVGSRIVNTFELPRTCSSCKENQCRYHTVTYDSQQRRLLSASDCNLLVHDTTSWKHLATHRFRWPDCVVRDICVLPDDHLAVALFNKTPSAGLHIPVKIVDYDGNPIVSLDATVHPHGMACDQEQKILIVLGLGNAGVYSTTTHKLMRTIIIPEDNFMVRTLMSFLSSRSLSVMRKEYAKSLFVVKMTNGSTVWKYEHAIDMIAPDGPFVHCFKYNDSSVKLTTLDHGDATVVRQSDVDLKWPLKFVFMSHGKLFVVSNATHACVVHVLE